MDTGEIKGTVPGAMTRVRDHLETEGWVASVPNGGNLIRIVLGWEVGRVDAGAVVRGSIVARTKIGRVVDGELQLTTICPSRGSVMGPSLMVTVNIRGRTGRRVHR